MTQTPMTSIQKYFRLLCLMLISTSLVSCSSDDDAGPVVNPPVDPVVIFSGTFVSSAHPTTGEAMVNEEKTILNFTEFKSDDGPDLDIYLASDLSDVTGDFINLGDIKGLDGNYAYDLPTNTNLFVYKYVVVWCKDFDVNFGYATLEP